MRFLALLLLFPSICFGEDWSREDTYRQSALTVLLIADWAQTRHIAKNPDYWIEPNKFLGQHPSVGRVNNYFTMIMVSNPVIAYNLPYTWRHAWQYVWIGMEGYSVHGNYKVGIKLSL